LAGSRIAALLIAAALAACIDPVADRTRRDFEECGRADLGSLEVRVDPGIVLEASSDGPEGPFVRLRANAPAVSLFARSKSAQAQRLTVRLENLPADTQLPEDALAPSVAGKSASFAVELPAGGEWTATVGSTPATAPFRFAWIGDVHSGLTRLERLRAAIDADPEIDFVLFAGDLVVSGGTEELTAFAAAADRFERPWYALLGNHDVSLSGDDQFQRIVGRLNFAFDYRGARFLMLDSGSATLGERAWEFARASLAGERPALRIAGMHVPPLDPIGLRDAGFASRAEGASLMGLLAARGVDLLLAGHLHTLALTEAAGVEVAISGNGGVGTEEKLDEVGLHYLAVDADPVAGLVSVAAIEVP